MLTRVFQRAVTNLIDESASSDAHVSRRNYFPSGKMGNSAQRFSALRSGGIFITKLYTKNHSSNIAKSVKRGTQPRLTQNRC